MIRNIDYSVEDGVGVIEFFTWNEDNERVNFKLTQESSLHFENPAGKFKSILGTNLKKQSFSNLYHRTKFIKENKHLNYFDIQTPQREFLQNMFSEVNDRDDFALNPLKTQIIDIEVAVEKEFPHPDVAKYPVNLITVHDSFEKMYHVFAWGDTIVRRKAEDCETDWSKVVIHQCGSEKELFIEWINWMKSDYPDVIAGFNSRPFDIPYLINRGEQIVGEDKILEISPCRKFRKEQFTSRITQQPIDTYAIAGITHLDYLILYRDKFSYKNLVNFKLDTVCEEELNARKIHYDGTYEEFWKNDFQLYTEYNIRDVELLVKLEEKLQYVQLVRQVCNMGLVEYEAIYKSLPYVIGSAVVAEKRNTGRLFPSPQNIDYENIDAKYPGAYVMDPVVGRYNSVMSMDLNSLYPSIMITLNVCPSTKFAKIINREEDGSITIRTTKGVVKELNAKEYKAVLDQHCTESSYDTLFIKPSKQKGCIPIFLESLYATRRAAKDTMLEWQMKVSEIKKKLKRKNISESRKEELEKELAFALLNDQRFGTKQLVLKIVLNTMYGILGNKYSPIFDTDLAGSITVTGQTIIKMSQSFVNAYFKKLYNAETDVVVYGDTDSFYFNAKPLSDAICGEDGDINDEGNIQLICKEGDKFARIINKFCFEKIVKDKLHSDQDWIQFKREMFSSGAMFFKKKRYIARVRNDEGVPVDKFKYVGVELTRQEIPPLVKTRLKDFVEVSFKEFWDNEKAQEKMNEIYEWFMALDQTEIACISGVNSWKEGIGFLRAAKGAGVHLRGSQYYNQLVGKLHMEDKYDLIQKGTKVRYVLLKDNHYKINVISYPDQYPDEFREHFFADYDKMFAKAVTSPMKHFFNVNKWQQFDKDFESSFLDV
jgi:DNA polymerase elongation subunit (family B)